MMHAGNAPETPAMLQELKAASDRGVLIVNVTQCPSGMLCAEDTAITIAYCLVIGGVAAGAYQAGAALVEAGVLSGYRNHNQTLTLSQFGTDVLVNKVRHDHGGSTVQTWVPDIRSSKDSSKQLTTACLANCPLGAARATSRVCFSEP